MYRCNLSSLCFVFFFFYLSIFCSPCFHGSTCFDKVNNFSCTCSPGFSGQRCEHHIDECNSQPCQNGATCVDEIGSYSYYCKPGYTGRNCESVINWCQVTTMFFTMAPFKVKSPKSLFALWHLKTQLVTIVQCTIFIGEDIYQLLNSISVRSGPRFSSRMAHNEVP